MKTLLHVGCGHHTIANTTKGFKTGDWHEIRLDIDPSVRPDLVGSMIDMAAIEDGTVDAVFSSHNIEHLHAHEVVLALKEFRRVLKDSGFCVITCPDLQAVCELVVMDRLTEPAYMSPAGPIAPIDMLYGLRSALSRGSVHMAHRCGFTEKVLRGTLLGCGFATIVSQRQPTAFNLWAVASKAARATADMNLLAAAHIPG